MKGRNNKQRGGSLASDYVMELTKRPCDAQFPAPEKLAFNPKEIVQNYGSEYKTTGGASKRRSQKGGVSFKGLEDMARSIVGNRVFDLYLKYLGITLLTPNTLVPIALIMGKETFEKVVREMRENEVQIQQGGDGFLDVRVPIIDDRLIGTGLKLAGLTALNVSPHTLVPLGLLMYVYGRYTRGKKEQAGGECGLWNNLDWSDVGDTFKHHAEPVDNSNISRPWQTAQVAGARHMTGDTIPPSAVQDATAAWAGQNVPNPLTRGAVYNNNQMQLTNTLPPQSQYNPPYAEQIETQLIEPTDNVCSLGNCGRVPQAMAGGRRNSRKQNRSRRGRKQRGGASSDWISTNYSCGPVNSIDMDPAQFRMFNKDAPYIPNDVLNGDTNASNRYYNFPSYMNSVDYKPLYLENVPCNGPQPNSS